ncbi:MAG: hypothetical protein LBQ36_07265 [Synergistaceae bacterium]|jgi:hypothetical protein|nr:hypothetical protein [Synergistaceae bacterium]
MAAKKKFSQKLLIFALIAGICIIAVQASFVGAHMLPCRVGASENAAGSVSPKGDAIDDNEAFRNMKDILHPSSKAEDSAIYYMSKNALCPFSDIDRKISKKTLIAARNAQAIARKKYEKEFLISITEGGKNVKNIPSIIEEWRDAVVPFYSETNQCFPKESLI